MNSSNYLIPEINYPHVQFKSVMEELKFHNSIRDNLERPKIQRQFGIDKTNLDAISNNLKNPKVRRHFGLN